MAAGDDRVGLLFWEMTLDDDEFKKKIKSSEKGLVNLDKSAKGSLGGLGKKFGAAGVAITAVVVGLSALTIKTVQSIAEQKILADSIGATTAEVVGLEIASNKLGVESSQVIDKMKEFGGITQFKTLADDVKNAGGPVDQLAKSIELFGNEGAKILPILQLGSEGLAEFEKQAIDTGNALSPEDTQKAAEAWDAYNDLQVELKGAATQLGVALSGMIPIITDLVKGGREMATMAGEAADGFELWAGEMLGWGDATAEAVTAEDILAFNTAKANKELERQRGILSGLAKVSEEAFSDGIFSQIILEKELAIIQKELNLTEEGFKKIKSLAASALGKGDTTTSIIGVIQGLDDGKIFNADDFKVDFDKNITGQVESVLDLIGKSFKLISKGGEFLVESTEKRNQRLKLIDEKRAELEGLRDPRAFAGRAMAGSVEAFRILQGSDDPAKTTAKATTEMAAQMKRWGTI